MQPYEYPERYPDSRSLFVRLVDGRGPQFGRQPPVINPMLDHSQIAIRPTTGRPVEGATWRQPALHHLVRHPERLQRPHPLVPHRLAESRVHQVVDTADDGRGIAVLIDDDDPLKTLRRRQPVLQGRARTCPQPPVCQIAGSPPPSCHRAPSSAAEPSDSSAQIISPILSVYVDGLPAFFGALLMPSHYHGKIILFNRVFSLLTTGPVEPIDSSSAAIRRLANKEQSK